MPPIEAQAARRRAELLWQKQTQAVAAAADSQPPQDSERQAADDKTARLRSLRLAKEAVEREAAMAAKPDRRKRFVTRL
jgi:hypothetical protein